MPYIYERKVGGPPKGYNGPQTDIWIKNRFGQPARTVTEVVYPMPLEEAAYGLVDAFPPPAMGVDRALLPASLRRRPGQCPGCFARGELVRTVESRTCGASSEPLDWFEYECPRCMSVWRD